MRYDRESMMIDAAMSRPKTGLQYVLSNRVQPAALLYFPLSMVPGSGCSGRSNKLFNLSISIGCSSVGVKEYRKARYRGQ
jgi:hypothetical protein